jgi:hypothetical protein
MNIQQIYDTLNTQQRELHNAVNSHSNRSDPAFQIEALAQQIAYLGGAIALILKALGAKTHE